ncbi:hypothetical protein [Scytonema sp. PRP1]
MSDWRPVPTAVQVALSRKARPEYKGRVGTPIPQENLGYFLI